MEIDLFKDRVLTLAEAAKVLTPITGTRKPVHISTIWRWHRRGARVQNTRVRLAIWRIGGRAVTTERALNEFVRLMAPTPDAEREPTEKLSRSAGRSKRMEAVETELNRAGL